MICIEHGYVFQGASLGTPVTVTQGEEGAGHNTQLADYRAADRFSAPHGETLLLFPPRVGARHVRPAVPPIVLQLLSPARASFSKVA